MSEPLECTSCGKPLDYGEPHNFYDCVRYLRDDVIASKDIQIKALVTALKAYMAWEPARKLKADYRSVMFREAEAAIKEATDVSQ